MGIQMHKPPISKSINGRQCAQFGNALFRTTIILPADSEWLAQTVTRYPFRWNSAFGEQKRKI